MKRKPVDYTPYQQKIIKRYYENAEGVGYQQLAELVGEIYLAEGKKRDQLWKRVATTLERLKLPKSRIDHLLEKRDPQLLANVVKELSG